MHYVIVIHSSHAYIKGFHYHNSELCTPHPTLWSSFSQEWNVQPCRDAEKRIGDDLHDIYVIA